MDFTNCYYNHNDLAIRNIFLFSSELYPEKHEIPQSIKAAVIDTIASSFLEFCVAVIAVIMIGRAEVGIPSRIGRGKYNGNLSRSYLEGQYFLSWRSKAAGSNALVFPK